MIKVIFLSLLIPFLYNGNAQTSNRYWVRFADKINTPFSIESPNEFLSQRSIDRRLKSNVAVDGQDLPVDPMYISELSILGGVTIWNSSKWFNAVSIHVSDSLTLDSIASLPFVLSIDKVKSLPLDPKIEFATKSLGHSNYHHLYYGMAFRQIEMHTGQLLHNLGFDGAGMTIAVLDAGFDRVDEVDVFSTIISEGRLLSTRDFVDGNNYVFNSSQHGTAVLSCMGANTPGKMVGTAPKANYVLIRTEDVASESLVEEDNWIAGAEFADSIGADILNTSLGYTQFDDSSMNHTYADMDGNTTRISIAADIAASRGILVVTSAGNMGSQPWHYISAPADADSTIAVAAVDSFMVRAVFSSYGPASDGDLKPNVASMGFRTACTFPNGNVQQANGTSFSAPVLAGMAACLWQAFPNKSNMEIKSLIERSGHQYNTPDYSLGYGVPNFYEAYLLGKEESLSNSDELLRVFPTQFTDKLNIHFHSQGTGNWKLSVLNNIGQELFVKSLDVTDNQYVQTVLTDELMRLSMGNYFICLSKDDQEISVSKVLKIIP